MTTFHDDADVNEVAKKVVDTMKAGTRQMGKVDRALSADSIAELDKAIAQMQNMLRMKRR